MGRCGSWASAGCWYVLLAACATPPPARLPPPSPARTQAERVPVPPPSATAPSAAPAAFERRGSSWTDAGASPATNVEVPRPRCLSEVGCPFPAVIIPLCDVDARAAPRIDVDSLAQAGASRRGEVLIEGTLLAHVAVTDSACAPSTCCNQRGGQLQLAQHYSHGFRLPLRSEAFPEAFRCGGDESLGCCGFASAHVLAFGTFDGSTLLEPRLCRLEP